FFFGAFFVDGNTDAAAGGCHGAGFDARDLALDVEVAYFAEVEQALVEFGPFVHAALVHVVRKVVDGAQARALVMNVGVGGGGVDGLEVDIVDADVADAAVAVLAGPAVDQVDK